MTINARMVMIVGMIGAAVVVDQASPTVTPRSAPPVALEITTDASAPALAAPAPDSGSAPAAPSRRPPPGRGVKPAPPPPTAQSRTGPAGKNQPTQTTPARCVPPAGEAIAADQILADLADGKDVVLRGRVIEGSLDADNAWPQADERRASRRIVRGSLQLESCRINGRVAFRRCVFLRNLEVPCTEINGDLDLTDSEARGGLEASRTIIHGEMRLGNLISDDQVSLAGAIVDDRVDLSGGWVRGSVSLDGAELRKDLDLERLTADEIDLAGTRIGGLTQIRDVLVLGPLEANDVTFGRGLTLDDVQVLGHFDISDSRSAETITLSRLIVGEDLMAPLATKAPVVFEGITIGHDLSLFEGRFAALTINGVQVKGSSEIEGARFSGRLIIRNTHFGQDFSAQDAVFDGDCEFRSVHFLGDNPMSGALFARAPLLVDTTLPFPPAVKSGDEEDEDLDIPDDEPPEDPK